MTARIVVSEALRPAPHGVLAREVTPDGDREPGAGGPPGLFGQLQPDAIEGDDVVLAHRPRLFLAEDLLEIRRPEGHEGAGGIARGAGEGRVVVRDEPLAQIRVGPGDGGDLGDAQLVDEAILQRAVEPLDPAARLGRIGRDVFDAEPREGTADLSELLAIDLAPAFGVRKAQLARSV
jgi:hypothetical protein